MARFLGSPKFQAFDSSGTPLASGKLYSYEVGTTTPKATYPTIADANASTNANANPVILNSRGEASVVISGTTKLVLRDSADALIWTVEAVPDSEATSLVDSNGNVVLSCTDAASSVNYLTMTNAATGAAPTLGAAGSDTNIDIVLQPKGSGTVSILGTSTNSAELRFLEDTDNGTNYVGIKCPTSLTASYTLTWPTAAGTSGQSLEVDNTGQLSFVTNTDTYVQEQYTEYTSSTTTTTTIPADDTIPQNTEGAQILTVSITPTSATNYLEFTGIVYAAVSSAAYIIAGVFQDSTANALAASMQYAGTTATVYPVYINYRMQAGTTSATTFKLRVGPSSAGTLTVNGYGGSRVCGGVLRSFLRVVEVAS